MDIYALNLDLNPHRLSGAAIDALRASGLTQNLWLALDAGERCVVAVAPDGLRVFDKRGEARRDWAEVHDLTISSDGLALRVGDDLEPRFIGLLRGTDDTELAAAITAAGREFVRVPPGSQIRTTIPTDDLSLTSTATAWDTRTPPERRFRPAVETIAWLLGLGIVLDIVAVSILNSSSEDTSDGARVFAWVLGTTGGSLLLVGLVAAGVNLGIQAAREHREL